MCIESIVQLLSVVDESKKINDAAVKRKNDLIIERVFKDVFGLKTYGNETFIPARHLDDQ